MAYSPKHLNGNMICAIDIETSGRRPFYHDILQLCILPLTPTYKPNKEYPLLHLKIRPARPENADLAPINKALFTDCMMNGMEPETAAERLREWFERLNLPMFKKIVPLGHNYMNFDRLFIMDWLGGPLNYDEFFRSDSRDTQASALFLNDMADWFSEKIPFPKWNLPYLCSQLGIAHPNAHDAVADCLAASEVYAKLMMYREHCCRIPQPSLNDSEIQNPPQSMDAAEWAAEFMRLFGDAKEKIDEGLMQSWFANAIMKGFDSARSEVPLDDPKKRT